MKRTLFLFPVAKNPTAFFTTLLFFTAFVAALIFNGAYLQYYSLAMLALFGWLLLALITGYHRHHAVIVTPFALAAGLFLAFLAFSLLYHPVPYLGALNLWWLGVFVILIGIFLFSPDADTTWQLTFPLLVLAITVLAGWGLMENLIYGLDPEASFYNKNSLAALINLALLPLAAWYLGTKHRQHRLAIIVGLVLFAFLLGIITSRGAMLGFALGIVMLAAMLWHHVSRPRLFALGGWLAGGFILATVYLQIVGSGGRNMFARMATLGDPVQSGNPRFALWEPAWEMLQSHPWGGIGLGAFFLKLPASARLDDKSAGYYVHNDYLQIATETGLPGLFFLLLVIGVLIWQFWRLNKPLSSTPEPGATLSGSRFEVIGLFCALLAFGLHSFFTYNFYVLPLMIVAGLYMARLDWLYARQPQAIAWCFTWKPHFRPISFYLISLAIAVMAGGYFTTLALSDRYYQQGTELAAMGQLQKAHFAFEHAQRLSPYMDSHFYTDADLLLHSAELLSEQDPKRSDLLNYADKKLDRAARLNPYQPYTPFLQGRLAELRNNNPKMAIDYYRRALDANPRFLPARLALARIFRQGNPEQAFAILAAGLKFRYQSISRHLFDYIELTAALAVQTGRDQLGARLDKQLDEIRQAYAQQNQEHQRPSQRY